MTLAKSKASPLERALRGERITPRDRLLLRAELVGPGQPLVNCVAGLVARHDAATLRRLYADDTPIHRLASNARGLPPPNGPHMWPYREGERSTAHAVRAMAALGLVLIGGPDDQDCEHLKAALTWYEHARASLRAVSFNWPPDALCDGDPRIERAAGLLKDVANGSLFSGPTLMVLFMLRRLSRPSVSRGKTRGLRVLFSQGPHGDTALLKMSFVRKAPGCLLPDPDRMGLFSADDRFRAALDRAWNRAGQDRIHGTVLWSLDADEGPIPYATDESLGAAFAVMLDEVRRAQRRGAVLRTIRRLVSGIAVVGRLTDDGDRLGSVGGYPGKLSAAARITTVIVPEADAAEAQLAVPGNNSEKAVRQIDIVPAATWRSAADLARRRDRGAVIRNAVAVFAVASLLIGGGVAVWQYSLANRQSQVNAKARADTISRRVAQQAKELRASQPALSLQLSAEAVRISPTTEAREGLYANLTQNLYRGSMTLPFPSSEPSPEGRLLVSGNEKGVLIVHQMQPDGRVGPVAARQSTVDITGDRHPVTSMAFSKDGRLLVTAEDDIRELQIWAVAPGGTLSRVGTIADGHIYGPHCLSISDDGKLLAVSTLQEGAAVYDISNPAMAPFITTVKDDGSPLSDLAFKPGTRELAITGSDSIVFWDLATPSSPRRLSGVPYRDNAGNDEATFSADGSLLALGTNGTLRVWNTSSLQRPTLLSSLAEHRGDNASKIVITAIGFSHRGSLVAIGWSNGRVEVWDVRRKSRLTVLQVSSFVWSTTFLPDDSGIQVSHDLISSDQDGLTTFSLEPEVHARPSGHFDGRTYGHAPIAPNGRVALSVLDVDTDIGGEDGHANIGGSPVLWNLSNPARPVKIITLPGSTHVASGAVLSPDGRRAAVLSGEDGGTGTLWDIADPASPHRITIWKVNSEYGALAFSPDGTRLATGRTSAVEVWDVSGSQVTPVRTLSLPGTTVTTFVEFSRDGGLLMALHDDNAADVWETGDYGQVAKIIEQQGPLTSGAFAPRGSVLALGAEESSVTLWDLAQHGKPARLSTINTPGGKVNELVFSLDGNVLTTTAEDRSASIWDVSDYTAPALAHTLPAAAGKVGVTSAVAMHGGFLAVSRDLDTNVNNLGAVSLWDVTDIKEMIADPVAQACRLTSPEIPKAAWDRYLPDVPRRKLCE